MQIIPKDVTVPATQSIEGVKPDAAPPAQETAKPQVSKEDEERFKQLAYREKAIRAQARKIAEEKRQIEELKQKYSQPQQPDNSWKDLIKKDLVGTLTDIGLSYDDVVNSYIASTPTDLTIRQLQNKIRELEEKQGKFDSSIKEQQTASYEQAKRQIKTEIGQLIKSSPEDYEIINSQGEVAQDAVLSLIEETFEKDGYLMDVGDAAKEVEDYLLDQMVGVSKLKKIQQKLTPTQQAAQQETPPPAKTETGVKSLSHTSQSSKPTTMRERRERAILAFQGKLT